MLKSFFKLVNYKVILGGIFLGLLVFGGLIWILWSSKAAEINQTQATAILKIIEAPTATVLPSVTTSTPTIQATRSADVPLPGVEVKIGEYVQVFGTGGEGLRLHASPGVTSQVQYVAIDSEVFVVKDGPKNADGYVWWYLQDPYSTQASGWGAANYLAVVKGP